MQVLLFELQVVCLMTEITQMYTRVWLRYSIDLNKYTAYGIAIAGWLLLFLLLLLLLLLLLCAIGVVLHPLTDACQCPFFFCGPPSA
jgi:hypothetical protein